MTPSSPKSSIPTPRPSAGSAKALAGRGALSEVRSGMGLGLGTGSTVLYFLEALGAAVRNGELEGIRGVATSRDTEERAMELGIPLVELAQAGSLDLAVDGADEVDPGLNLIKGLGGALLREKMVVQAARRFVVIVDEGKRVERLGSGAPVPVEVVPFAWEAHLPFFQALGADPVLRLNPDRSTYLTDNANPVIDLHFEGGVPAPEELDGLLRGRAGVVETGLFLGMADRVLVGTSVGEVVTLDREGENA